MWTPHELTPGGRGAAPDMAGLAALVSETAAIDALLLEHKALVFRGFNVEPASLGPFLDALLPNRIAYVHGNSPRSKVGDNVYTSTEYPAEYTISMHNEMSYTNRWPARLLFYCEREPSVGGATPIVDGARWLAVLDPELRDTFRQGVRYTQNLHGGQGFGRSWQDTFESNDHAEVEKFLSTTDATWEWKDDGGIRVSQIRPATIPHPVTGVEVWFNQADQWHLSALDKKTAEALRAVFAPEDLPQDVTYADGSPIPEPYIAQIRDRGLAEAVDVRWSTGDLLLIDNVLVAHGRRPFEGPRRVLVAMSD
jgi:alpha-ketoglutarate-dependent taurine dioxygenase